MIGFWTNNLAKIHVIFTFFLFGHQSLIRMSSHTRRLTSNNLVLRLFETSCMVWVVRACAMSFTWWHWEKKYHEETSPWPNTTTASTHWSTPLHSSVVQQRYLWGISSTTSGKYMNKLTQIVGVCMKNFTNLNMLVFPQVEISKCVYLVCHGTSQCLMLQLHNRLSL